MVMQNSICPMDVYTHLSLYPCDNFGKCNINDNMYLYHAQCIPTVRPFIMQHLIKPMHKFSFQSNWIDQFFPHYFFRAHRVGHSSLYISY